MKRWITAAKVTVLVLAIALGGCASILNPFDKTEFPCPNTGVGKCVSVETAYNEAVQSSSGYRSPFITEVQPGAKNSTPQDNRVSITGVAAYPPLTAAERNYQDQTYDKLTNLLKKPVAPIVAPPDVVRVLMLPYKASEGDELFMYRYSYFMASPPKFVVGDYLVEEEH